MHGFVKIYCNFLWDEYVCASGTRGLRALHCGFNDNLFTALETYASFAAP